MGVPGCFPVTLVPMTTTAIPKFFVVDKHGHTLRADFAGSYFRMMHTGMPAGGIDVFSRTLDEQKQRWDDYLHHRGPRAAYPSPTAPHVRGIAMDFHTTTAKIYMPSRAFLWAMAGGNGKSNPVPGEKIRANLFGLFRTVSDERWHMEYDPERDQFRKSAAITIAQRAGFKTVAAFQEAHGLTPDGDAGPKTWHELLTFDKEGL